MIGFFIIRRMIELNKVSSATKSLELKVFSCPNRGKHVTKHNHCDVDKLYDFDNEKPTAKKASYLSNQFIHAYTSYVSRDETRNWSDVVIVSDFDRNTCIWRVPLSEIHRLFSTAARDYPRQWEMVYNETKGDFDVSTE
jgi:hypothetical protein